MAYMAERDPGVRVSSISVGGQGLSLHYGSAPPSSIIANSRADSGGRCG